MYARIGGELERLAPGQNFGWTGYDANNITEYDNRIRNAALAFARQSFQGQGQVTENERAMIDEATAKRGTLTTATTVKVLKAMRDVQQRKIDIYNTWSSNAGGVQEDFKGNFSGYVAFRIDLADKEQKAANAAAKGNSDATNSGSTQSGINWSVTK